MKNSCLDGVQKILEYSSSPVPVVSKSPWTVSGKFFYQDGKIVRRKGFSSFKLLDRFDKGEDIKPIIDQYPNANLARVLLYTPVKDWGNDAWGIPSIPGTIDFCHYMADKGLQVGLCLVTDNDSSRIDQIKHFIGLLKGQGITNLQLEAVNEPFVKSEDDKLNPDIFKNLLSGSGFLYTSGIYSDNKRFWGQFWLDHSSRSMNKAPASPAWCGKGGHSLMEAYNGGGPNSGDEPALRIACCEDEPIRSDESNFDEEGLYAYAASCSLFGAGATFHSTPGKLSKLLEGRDLSCKDMFFKGLDIFPLDAANQPYNGRIVEPGNEEGGPTDNSRTYLVGKYSIRIKQVGLNHPQEGWKSLDPYGICWSR